MHILYLIVLPLFISIQSHGTRANYRQMLARTGGSCVLFEDGRVKCWGDNRYGQLGYGDRSNRGDQPNEMSEQLSYIDLGKGLKAIAITGGETHSCALLENGGVKCWGYNGGGLLGLGDTENRGDNPNEMGDQLPYVNLGSRSKISAITCGAGHTCALFEDGRVKCWGGNHYGELGYGDRQSRGKLPNEMGEHLLFVELGSDSKVISLSAGMHYSCALFENGKAKCWGDNHLGQLGVGNKNNYGDGSNEMGIQLPHLDLGDEKIISIKPGGYFSCALFDSGRVKCWGDNRYGQLGLGDVNNRGDEPDEMGNHLYHLDLGKSLKVISLGSGSHQACALFDSKRVKCWGANIGGRLGLGEVANRGDGENEMGENLPFVDLGLPVSWLSDVTSAYHACAYFKNHSIKCWGNNYYGELGLGDAVSRGMSLSEMGDNLEYVLFEDRP